MADKKHNVVTGRLDPEVFRKARIKMAKTGYTWQGLIEGCILDFLGDDPAPRQSPAATLHKRDRELIEQVLAMIEDGDDDKLPSIRLLAKGYEPRSGREETKESGLQHKRRTG